MNKYWNIPFLLFISAYHVIRLATLKKTHKQLLFGDKYAKCSMHGKTIQCLPNPSQHLSIYVQQFPFYFESQVQKIAVFTYRSPHFCFSWRRLCDYHAICSMDGKTIQCLPNPSQHQWRSQKFSMGGWETRRRRRRGGWGKIFGFF